METTIIETPSSTKDRAERQRKLELRAGQSWGASQGDAVRPSGRWPLPTHTGASTSQRIYQQSSFVTGIERTI